MLLKEKTVMEVAKRMADDVFKNARNSQKESGKVILDRTHLEKILGQAIASGYDYGIDHRGL